MTILITSAWIILTCVILLWLISIPLRNVSIIDLFWGSGFVMVAWLSYFSARIEGKVCYLLPLLVTIWGLRLSLYLAKRNVGHGEDKRYAAMRQHAGPKFVFTSLFSVFLLQGLIMWVISLPLQIGIPRNPGVLNGLTIAGSLLWAFGFLMEAVGDWQLARFKSNPENRGKVFDRGLWRYTRHPNYFGDCCQWWAFWILSISPGGPYWTLISPLLMTGLLLIVSGVSLLEKDLSRSKPEYARYISRTSPFIPWPPRKTDSLERAEP